MSLPPPHLQNPMLIASVKKAQNGMLHLSFATLEGEHEFLDFSRALHSLDGSPLSISVGNSLLVELVFIVCLGGN